MFGEFTGKILSTPTPLEIFLIIKVSLIPDPFMAMIVPSKTCSLSLMPSFTLTYTLTV